MRPASPGTATAAEADFVATVFGAAQASARRYAEMLVTAGVQRGLVGPQEAGRIWSRHLFNCAAAAQLIPDVGVIADLGSGAGLPGIVLALLRPRADVVLIEPKLRRAEFLDEVITELGLFRTTVLRCRAEDVPVDSVGRFDVVTARALAPLPRLVPLAMPLLTNGGRLVAIKGARAEAELAAAEPQFRACQAAQVELRTVSAPWLTPAVVLCTAVAGPVAAQG